MTLVDFVRLNWRRNPEGAAIVDDSGRLTHRELSERAWALAQGLITAGVKPGDRIGVLSGNSNFAIETYLGSVVAGGVYVPFNWRWAPEELRHGIGLVTPSVILVESGQAANMNAALANGFEPPCPIIWEGETYESFLGEAVDPEIPVDPEDPAVILFTGGTTGFSKGVVLPHRAVLFNSINELADLGFGQGPNAVGLCVVPLFHSASLLCVFGPHYISGGTSVIMKRFTEQEFAQTVEREGVTSTFIVPNMIRRLMNAGALSLPAMASLKQLHTGAGLLRMPDKEAIKANLPGIQLFFRYGLTEAGPMVTRLVDADIMNPDLDGSIGLEYSFAEVQLQDDEGCEVPAGALGEICVRGPGLMLGYFNQPDATASTLVNGWLKTGDLAVRDENGYLYFRDRAKDMIKTGGENVYASEIEQLLYAHPAAMECGVVGVPSLEWDEEVRAVVALREGAVATADDLSGYLRQHLAGYKIPKVFLFVEPGLMPINPSGKIVKSQLRQVVGW